MTDSSRRQLAAFLPLRPFSFLTRRPTLPLYRSHDSTRSLPVALEPPPTPTPTPIATAPTTPEPPRHNPLQTALILHCVPFFWGTYPVAAQFLTHLPVAPPPTFLNLLIYITALVPLPFLRSPKATLPHIRGAELGTYLFLGTTLLLAALQHTTAPRVALLVQTTTIFVPALSYLLGRPVTARVAGAAVLALAGVAILEQASGSLSRGDGLALLSAICYSVHVLRLDNLNLPSLPLVEAKTRFQTLLAGLVVAVHPGPAVAYVQQLPNLPAWELYAMVGGVVWLGFASTALATWLQIIGQRRVGASRAAVFYATQPAWAVAIAYATGLDAVAPNDILGACMIVVAGLLAGLE